MRAINPDVAALVEAGRTANAPKLEALPPHETRRIYAASRRALQPPFDSVEEVRDIQVPAPGGLVTLRVFRPASADPVLPCLLFLHGGGWVLGDLDSHEGICRRIARSAHCCVVAVDYRLAPEHVFPAAVEDCVSALRWVVDNAVALRIDATRVAVGGDSAGGTLAAVLALMGRDGTVPAPMFQVLLYPAVDLCMTGESYETVAEGMPVTADTMRFFIDHYAPNMAERHDWRASPASSRELGGSAPGPGPDLWPRSALHRGPALCGAARA